MKLTLFDHPTIRAGLLPFTFTRPVAALRTGILTLAEKWSAVLGADISFHTADYLQEKFPESDSSNSLYANGGLLADEELAAEIAGLPPGEALIAEDGIVLAFRDSRQYAVELISGQIPDGWHARHPSMPFRMLRRPCDMFLLNGDEIRRDFNRITRGRKSEPVDDRHTVVYGDDIFIEAGVRIKAAVLNSEQGPIYLGRGAEIGEGSVVRGPFVLGENSSLSLGSRIRGDNSIGPGCKVGGELANSVFLANSNKAHDGYLGNSIIGEWCNIGAGTVASNMKNNMQPVKLWNYRSGVPENTGLLFCGLMMADHAKCAINTAFNTGTVVGVGANIFGHGTPPSYIPNFAWGGASGFQTYRFDKFLETVSAAMQRRNRVMAEVDIRILSHIFGLNTILPEQS